jgi:hypothetical protein
MFVIRLQTAYQNNGWKDIATNQPTAQVYSLPSPCAHFTYTINIDYLTKCFIASQQFRGIMQMAVQPLQIIRILNGCFANTMV